MSNKLHFADTNVKVRVDSFKYTETGFWRIHFEMHKVFYTIQCQEFEELQFALEHLLQEEQEIKDFLNVEYGLKLKSIYE
jgi:hypothetical protein